MDVTRLTGVCGEKEREREKGEREVDETAQRPKVPIGAKNQNVWIMEERAFRGRAAQTPWAGRFRVEVWCASHFIWALGILVLMILPPKC